MTDQAFPFKRNYSTSKSIQFSLRTGEFSELAATASQNLIGSADKEREKRVDCSYEVEVPPAKAWWCPEVQRESSVATKLKHHRLKPGGVHHFSKESINLPNFSWRSGVAP